MKWKSLVVGITCEIIFSFLGIDELLDVAQYLEVKVFTPTETLVLTQVD